MGFYHLNIDDRVPHKTEIPLHRLFDNQEGADVERMSLGTLFVLASLHHREYLNTVEMEEIPKNKTKSDS